MRIPVKAAVPLVFHEVAKVYPFSEPRSLPVQPMIALYFFRIS